MSDELLTGKELAERLRLRPVTIAAWTKAGRIPSVRVGRKVIRYDFMRVREALEAGMTGEKP